MTVDRKTAGFPAGCWEASWNRTALEDYLLRRFVRQAGRFSRQAKGSGKSGVLAVTAPGQEVLERTDCQIHAGAITVRFEVGFPANGRTINAPEQEKILFEFLPSAWCRACCMSTFPRESRSGSWPWSWINTSFERGWSGWS